MILRCSAFGANPSKSIAINTLPSLLQIAACGGNNTSSQTNDKTWLQLANQKFQMPQDISTKHGCNLDK